MQPHQERVLIEKAELDDKCLKLNSFINGETYKTLNSIEQSLLTKQLAAMTAYSEILEERITTFK